MVLNDLKLPWVMGWVIGTSVGIHEVSGSTPHADIVHMGVLHVGAQGEGWFFHFP